MCRSDDDDRGSNAQLVAGEGLSSVHRDGQSLWERLHDKVALLPVDLIDGMKLSVDNLEAALTQSAAADAEALVLSKAAKGCAGVVGISLALLRERDKSLYKTMRKALLDEWMVDWLRLRSDSFGNLKGDARALKHYKTAQKAERRRLSRNLATSTSSKSTCVTPEMHYTRALSVPPLVS